MPIIIPNTFADKSDIVQLSDLDENFSHLATELDAKSTQLESSVNDLSDTVDNLIIQAELSTSVFTKQIYLQSSTPPISPSGGTYNFLTNTFVPPAGWFETRPPSSTIPTYASEYTFSTSLPSVTVTAGNWSAPTIVAQNGTAGNNGISTYTLTIYSNNISTTPSGGKYTFSTDTFDASTLTSGWSRSMPPTGIIPTYRSTYTFNTTTPGVAVNAGTWSTPTIVAINGTDGVDAVSAVLSNQAHSIPADSAGLNAIYTFSGTEIHVYEGGSELIYDGVGTSDGTWKVIATGTNITPGSLNNTSPFVTVGNHSNITSDVATVSFAITGKRLDGTAFNLTQVQSISRVRTGFDATSYKLMTSTSVIRKTLQNEFVPATFSVNSLKLSGAAPSNYSGRFKIYENEDTLPVYTSSTDEASKTYFPSIPAVNKITIELYEAGSTTNLLDTETIVVVNDGPAGADGNSGLDALSTVLSNEAQTIPTDSNGLNAIYTGSGTSIRVYEGTTELSYDGVGTTNGSFKVTALGTGITAGTISDSGTFATVGNHSNMVTDKASVDYTITGKRYNGDNFTLSRTQSFSKAKAGTAGNPGADATLYRLLLSSYTLQKSVLGNFNPASIIISCTSQTGINSPVAYLGRFKIYENDSSTPTYESSANESTKLYTPSGSSVTSIKVELYLAGGTVKIDEQTIVVVNDGATGEDGAGAITPIISNSNHSIPTDYLGGNGIYTGSGTSLRLFEGTNELEYDGVGTADGTYKVLVSGNNITAGSAIDSGMYATISDHSNMTADKASVEYTFVGKRQNGISISTTVTQSLTKAKSGEAGANATAYWLTSSAATIQKSVAGVFNPTSISFTAITKTGTDAPVTYAGRFKIYENNSTTASYTSAADEATKTYTPSSSSVTSIKVELYLAGGTTNKIDEQYIPVVLDGTDSITVFLSNSAHTVPTDFNGNNGTYTASGTLIRVYEGSTELLYQPTVAASGQWTVSSSGVGITVGSITDSGSYATVADHSNMTSDTATITYTITGLRRNGTSFNATALQTFSKAKSGGPGADANMYRIILSAAAIQKNISGVFTPSTLTASLYKSTGNAAPALYSGRFIIAYSLDGSSFTNAYTSASDESQYTYTVPSNSKLIRIRSYLAGGTTTLVDEQTVPVVSDGDTGQTGATGQQGNSFRICYSVTTLSSLASTPTTIATSGSTSYPPNGSWGTGTVWTANPSPLTAGQALYQSDGIYNPTTNITTWNVPYLSNLKVGSLSAISSDLGTITAGSLSINNKFIVDGGGNATIRSGTSGARLEIKNNVIKVYDTNGVLRVQLGDLSA